MQQGARLTQGGSESIWAMPIHGPLLKKGLTLTNNSILLIYYRSGGRKGGITNHNGGFPAHNSQSCQNQDSAARPHPQAPLCQQVFSKYL